MKKKILVFYPHNFLELSSGTHKRITELMVYFAEREMTVDIFSINGFTNTWRTENSIRSELFREKFLFNWRYPLKGRKLNDLRRMFRRLEDFALPAMKRQFEEVAENGCYDYIFISYVYWANLVDNVKSGIKIMDCHDLVSLNAHLLSGQGEFKYGRMFQDEVCALDKFDYVFCISEEESVIMSSFASRPRFVNVPTAMPRKFSRDIVSDNTFDYDLVFVGSGDNRFNRDGLIWFVERVMPLRPALKVAVAGNVCDHLSGARNLKLLNYVKDLEDVYKRSKAVICPLRGGTGLKIKVAEALSYGKPVITTKWGLSGILQKENNGCIVASDEKSFVEAIDRIINDRDYYELVRRQAMDFFQRKFSRDICWKNLDELFST